MPAAATYSTVEFIGCNLSGTLHSGPTKRVKARHALPQEGCIHGEGAVRPPTTPDISANGGVSPIATSTTRASSACRFQNDFIDSSMLSVPPALISWLISQSQVTREAWPELRLVPVRAWGLDCCCCWALCRSPDEAFKLAEKHGTCVGATACCKCRVGLCARGPCQHQQGRRASATSSGLRPLGVTAGTPRRV